MDRNLARVKIELNRSRRRSRGLDRPVHHQVYMDRLERFRRAVNKAQATSWSRFVTAQLGHNPCSIPYKLARRKTGMRGGFTYGLADTPQKPR